MERNRLMTAALGLTLVALLAAPTVGWARAEVLAQGDAACCFDLGLRLSITLEGNGMRGALLLRSRELFGVTLAASDAVRWGVPIVSIVAAASNARTVDSLSSLGTSSQR